MSAAGSHARSTSRADALVLDWGIGGVALLGRLRAAYPSARLVYRCDQGSPPYGTLSERALAGRVDEHVAWAARASIPRVFVACNAASTILDRLAPRGPRVVGVIETGARLVGRHAGRRVGVIGGTRTVESGAHARLLPDRRVRAIDAQPLSAAIEAGRPVVPLIEHIAAPYRGRLDLVLSACTHYVAARAALERAFAVPLLDPIDEVMADLRADFKAIEAARGDAPGWLRAQTTGEPEPARAAALRAFGVELGALERAELDARAWLPTLDRSPHRTRTESS